MRDVLHLRSGEELLEGPCIVVAVVALVAIVAIVVVVVVGGVVVFA